MTLIFGQIKIAVLLLVLVAFSACSNDVSFKDKDPVSKNTLTNDDTSSPDKQEEQIFDEDQPQQPEQPNENDEDTNNDDEMNPTPTPAPMPPMPSPTPEDKEEEMMPSPTPMPPTPTPMPSPTPEEKDDDMMPTPTPMPSPTPEEKDDDMMPTPTPMPPTPTPMPSPTPEEKDEDMMPTPTPTPEMPDDDDKDHDDDDDKDHDDDDDKDNDDDDDKDNDDDDKDHDDKDNDDDDKDHDDKDNDDDDNDDHEGFACRAEMIKDVKLIVSLATLHGKGKPIMAGVSGEIYLSELEAGIEVVSNKDFKANQLRLMVVSAEAEMTDGSTRMLQLPSGVLKLHLAEKVHMEEGMAEIIMIEKDQVIFIGGKHCKIKPSLKGRCRK